MTVCRSFSRPDEDKDPVPRSAPASMPTKSSAPDTMPCLEADLAALICAACRNYNTLTSSSVRSGCHTSMISTSRSPWDRFHASCSKESSNANASPSRRTWSDSPTRKVHSPTDAGGRETSASSLPPTDADGREASASCR